jgi:hypothetical protein
MMASAADQISRLSEQSAIVIHNFTYGFTVECRAFKTDKSLSIFNEKINKNNLKSSVLGTIRKEKLFFPF